MAPPAPQATTEALHPTAEDLDLIPVEEVVERLQREDRRALEAVEAARASIAAAARAASDALSRGGRILYVGAGTSGRLGVLDASELPPTFGLHPSRAQAVIAGGWSALRHAVEGAEDDAEAGAQAVASFGATPTDWICGISASGTTPFVLGALDEARRAGSTTALICSSPVSSNRKPASLIVQLDTGPELLAGSTRLKAGTATKLALNAISTAAMIRLGKIYRGRMIDLQPTNAKLKARALRMVCELTGLKAPAARTLLEAAGGQPRVAMAMHLASVDRAEAERLLTTRSLRDLEK